MHPLRSTDHEWEPVMTVPKEVQAANPGVKFNDSPRLANGDSAMFVRILDKKGVKRCMKQLIELNPTAPAFNDGTLLRVWAPDGDLAFSFMPTDDRREYFLC